MATTTISYKQIWMNGKAGRPHRNKNSHNPRALYPSNNSLLRFFCFIQEIPPIIPWKDRMKTAHSPSQFIVARFSANHVQISSPPILGGGWLLEVRHTLIFEKTIAENHGQVEYSPHRAHLLTLLNQSYSMGLFCDVQRGDHNWDSRSPPEIYASSLIPRSDSWSARQYQSTNQLYYDLRQSSLSQRVAIKSGR